MSVPLRHLLSQGPVLRALGGVAVSSLRRARSGVPATPGPWMEAELSPRPAPLVRDYVRHTGGDPPAYAGALPPHMFPQWAFPLAAKTLSDLPYPAARVINAGCRIEIARLDVDRRAGLDFAALTGDFNPIHWVPVAARAAGFKGGASCTGSPRWRWPGAGARGRRVRQGGRHRMDRALRGSPRHEEEAGPRGGLDRRRPAPSRRAAGQA